MTSKFALVIANTEYQDASFAKLTAPGKDAEEFAQVLHELAAFDDVQVLLNEGEGKTRRSIARFFAERKRDELLLLYFSGHGVRNEQGHLFLAANDTEINILEASGIPAEFVTNSMNNSRSHRQLLILDCCNSGAFAHGSKSASGIGKSMGIATAFEGSGFGRVVLTATDATQFAWEGDKVIGNTQKSVFTHFLIEGLKGEADRDGDGRIHVDELYDYAYEQIVTRTPKQTPGKWSYKQQGDLVLRENLKPREIKPAPLPPELLEMLAHPNSGVRRAGLQELIGLLDGKHQGLARAARETLLEIAENDDSLTLRRSVSDALKARGFVLEQVIAQSDFDSFQQGPVPDSIETPKVEHKEEKKLEKPVSVLPHQEQSLPVDVPLPLNNVSDVAEKKVRTKTQQRTIDWNRIASKLNPRTTGIILLVLLVVFLGVMFGPTLKNKFVPGIGSTMVSGKDGATLVYVPAGEFTMGSNSNSDEQPIHKVTLDAFWIDKTEVTVRMYTLCVEAGACTEPTNKNSWTHSSYYDNAEFYNYPVIYVNWNMAKTYCEWAGRRLPTEAEWEKAARGKDENIYPWGNGSPNANLLNYNSNIGDTTEVGSYLDGASIYVALDMAGNVWEWVSSSELFYPYDPADGRENLTSLLDARVLRGGTWRDVDDFVRSAYRDGNDPTASSNYIGFRCAVSANRQADITPLAQASTNIPSATQTSQPTKTDTPLPTETLNPATPTLGIGSTVTGKDGMTLLYVPAGEFTMGREGGYDNKPLHTVDVEAFWIDQTEVTNRMYAKCVDAAVCDPPVGNSSYTRDSYYGNPDYYNYPVIYVLWNNAKNYCEWVDRHLPTEAEWEKAARGTDGGIYPWGDAFDGSLLNFCDVNCGLLFVNAENSIDDGFADTAPVGNYPDGASPFGALDMAGNVSEWVDDWYDAYPGNEESNPRFGTNYRVHRGGWWYRSSYDLRADSRDTHYQDAYSDYIGFRCAMDTTP